MPKLLEKASVANLPYRLHAFTLKQDTSLLSFWALTAVVAARPDRSSKNYMEVSLQDWAGHGCMNVSLNY